MNMKTRGFTSSDVNRGIGFDASDVSEDIIKKFIRAYPQLDKLPKNKRIQMFKLEWIGLFIRYIYRWLQCKVRGKHRYFLRGLVTFYPITGHRTGTFVCDVCHKVRVVK